MIINQIMFAQIENSDFANDDRLLGVQTVCNKSIYIKYKKSKLNIADLKSLIFDRIGYRCGNIPNEQIIFEFEYNNISNIIYTDNSKVSSLFIDMVAESNKSLKMQIDYSKVKSNIGLKWNSIQHKFDLRSTRSETKQSEPTKSENFSQIFVKTNPGKTIVIECDLANTTILELKYAIGHKTNSNPDIKRLTFASKFLDDNATLESYDIHNDSTIHEHIRIIYPDEFRIVDHNLKPLNNIFYSTETETEYTIGSNSDSDTNE